MCVRDARAVTECMGEQALLLVMKTRFSCADPNCFNNISKQQLKHFYLMFFRSNLITRDKAFIHISAHSIDNICNELC